MASSSEFEIVSSLTQPGASVETIVQELLDLTAAASVAAHDDTGDDALSTHIHKLWFALIERVVADTPPSQQDRLVEFIRTLRKQKVVDPATNSPLQYNLVAEHSIPVWNGLPLFGMSVRDEWNFDPDSCTPAEEYHHYNKLVYLAKLTNLPENELPDTGLDFPPYDFSLYALWNFRDVFEQDCASEPVREILLRGASLWMIHCADRLWANVQANRSFLHPASGTNPAQAGDRLRSENEWTGFNKERWELWVDALRQVRGLENNDVTELVAKALQNAERVEKST